MTPKEKQTLVKQLDEAWLEYLMANSVNSKSTMDICGAKYIGVKSTVQKLGFKVCNDQGMHSIEPITARVLAVENTYWKNFGSEKPEIKEVEL